jgi:hypothetical protein
LAWRVGGLIGHGLSDSGVKPSSLPISPGTDTLLQAGDVAALDFLAQNPAHPRRHDVAGLVYRLI